MAGGRIETEWLPLTWLCATAGICAIDRIRMLGYKDTRKRQAGAVQRGFIPQYAERVPEAKPVEEIAVSAPEAPAPTQPPVPTKPPSVVTREPLVQPPVVSTPAPAPAPAPALVRAPVPPPPAKEIDIYVALVGEGLNLMRTVKAEHVGRDFYKIVEAMPEGETWEFRPGQVVRCKKRNLSTGKGLVAVEEAPRAS